MRLHTGSLALENVKLPDNDGTITKIKLLSVPLYGVGQLDRLLRAAFVPSAAAGSAGELANDARPS